MNKLDRIRSSVNSLDEQLLELLAKRRALSLEAVKEKYAAQIFYMIRSGKLSYYKG